MNSCDKTDVIGIMITNLHLSYIHSF